MTDEHVLCANISNYMTSVNVPGDKNVEDDGDDDDSSKTANNVALLRCRK